MSDFNREEENKKLRTEITEQIRAEVMDQVRAVVTAQVRAEVREEFQTEIQILRDEIAAHRDDTLRRDKIFSEQQARDRERIDRLETENRELREQVRLLLVENAALRAQNAQNLERESMLQEQLDKERVENARLRGEISELRQQIQARTTGMRHKDPTLIHNTLVSSSLLSMFRRVLFHLAPFLMRYYRCAWLQ
jgi:hypothetical protein